MAVMSIRPRAKRKVYPGESIGDAIRSLPDRGGIVYLMPGEHYAGTTHVPRGVLLRGWLPWWRRVLRAVGL